MINADSEVFTKRDIVGDNGTLIPSGSSAIVVEVLELNKAFLVEFQIPAPELVTNFRWETSHVDIQDIELR